MYLHLETSGAVVLLAGDAERTARVAHKYKDAASIIQCPTPQALVPAAALRPVLAVICVAENDQDAFPSWRTALAKTLPGTLITVDTEDPIGTVGTVFLIGAGPGLAGYMTVAAHRALASSDVVLIDHLAPVTDIELWAPGAEIIDVGKVPGEHKVPQRQIDQMMVNYALAGKNVARVKGGDPYVFGRGTEELYACERAGVPVEVISGVTSSIAVPASAGVPMTLRKVSHMFTVVSGHAELTDAELDLLAGFVTSGGTISLLMGVRTLPHTVAGLLERGVEARTPVGTFENVYREGERVRYSTLERAAEDLADLRPPAITVIGRVVDAGYASGTDESARRDALLQLALSEGRDAKA
ncbi:uroporphyrinogen-III C-methyltransferase [Rothia sp. ZJ932]|uniref:uroporphyrinogen-III C-methyltransferase n=1 Tax=Rothia sp. ZJ932 TaxID=2810516 RepID=UPI001967891F|nr:uroporphyrinogen-III C-methyltransferase [Rothia sp. ZJ932]QRZ62407.1 uroporphyrinogen-III C-methyltransferase [Rothia sp. ZJ932]